MSELDRLKKLIPSQFAQLCFELNVNDNDLPSPASLTERATALIKLLDSQGKSVHLTAKLNDMGIVPSRAASPPTTPPAQHSPQPSHHAGAHHMSTPPVLAILCDDKDIPHANTLHHHLKFAENKDLVKVWHPGLIPPGANIQATREQALRDALVVVLLISPDLMANNTLEVRSRSLIDQKPSGTAIPLKVRHTPSVGQYFHQGIQTLTILEGDREEAWAKATESIWNQWEAVTSAAQQLESSLQVPR
jgi:hypothetical protein